MPALTYNADVERYRFLLRWRHTVLPMVVRDPVYWLLMCIHCFFVVLRRDMPWSDTSSTGSASVFDGCPFSGGGMHHWRRPWEGEILPATLATP